MMNFFKIKKTKVHNGDEILVISGKYKGKKGIVKCVLSKKGEVIIDGVNLYKKAMKISQNNVENFSTRERSMNISKVRVVNKAQKTFVKKKSDKNNKS